MRHFWGSFFDQLRDCGRSGTLFMLVLLGILATAVGAGLVYSWNAVEFALHGLPFVILASLLHLLWTLRRKRSRARLSDPAPLASPLSRDELRVARSKLMKRQDRPGLWVRH